MRNVVICKADKFVFVSTPKCATNSMYRLLTHEFGGVRPGTPFHVNIVPVQYVDWFTWGIVRNPYARAVSIWWRTTVDPTARRIAYAEVGSTEFATFLRYMLTHPPALARRSLDINQSDWLRSVRLDRIVKLETLHDDLAALPFWRDGIAVPLLNPSGGNYADWRTYIDDETGPLIREWAGEDFTRYGYSEDVGERRAECIAGEGSHRRVVGGQGSASLSRWGIGTG